MARYLRSTTSFFAIIRASSSMGRKSTAPTNARSRQRSQLKASCQGGLRVFSLCRLARSGKCIFRRSLLMEAGSQLFLARIQHSSSRLSWSQSKTNRRPWALFRTSHRWQVQLAREARVLRMRLQVAFTLVVGVLPLFAAAGWARNPQDRGRQIATWPDATSAELADVPPGQVIVSYENGELTIRA